MHSRWHLAPFGRSSRTRTHNGCSAPFPFECDGVVEEEDRGGAFVGSIFINACVCSFDCEECVCLFEGAGMVIVFAAGVCVDELKEEEEGTGGGACV